MPFQVGATIPLVLLGDCSGSASQRQSPGESGLLQKNRPACQQL